MYEMYGASDDHLASLSTADLVRRIITQSLRGPAEIYQPLTNLREESCGHHTSYNSSLGVTTAQTTTKNAVGAARFITSNNTVIWVQADMTVTTIDRIIGTREWTGRLRFIRSPNH